MQPLNYLWFTDYKMTDHVTAGLELMMVGMGIVFLFLALLVVAVIIMSRLVSRYLPETPDVIPARAVAGNNGNVIAAITVAVHKYRAEHRPKE
jgi:oxaloacetate decarboxylase gamma subunit